MDRLHVLIVEKCIQIVVNAADPKPLREGSRALGTRPEEADDLDADSSKRLGMDRPDKSAADQRGLVPAWSDLGCRHERYAFKYRETLRSQNLARPNRIPMIKPTT